MVAKNHAFLMGIALSTMAASAMAAGGRGSSSPNPVIVSASVAPVAHQITIRGYAFGASAPVVLLGQQRLLVVRNHENEIVAALPGSTPPATYTLQVIRNKTLQSPPFTLMVMADKPSPSSQD